MRCSALVFVENVEMPRLSEEDAHHLTRVKRLKQGSEVTVTDGQGKWRLCALEVDGKQSQLIVKSDISFQERPNKPLSVGVAMIPAAGFDLCLQKLTV